jgi:hypothetical protein
MLSYNKYMNNNLNNNKFNFLNNGENSSGLKFIQECPVCHTPRRSFKANILEETDSNRLIYLTCSQCQSSVIMLVSLGLFGVDSIGLLTDLLPLEVMKFKEGSIVGANDLLDLHEILRHNGLTINWASV